MIVRDKTSNALINEDLSELNKYKVQREQYRKIDQLQKQFEELKIQLLEIKEMIRKE